ncbi:MAG: LptF/LptG family permease [Mariprofundaceae bacterium]
MPILFRWFFYGCLARMLGVMTALLAIYVIIEAFDKARYLGHGFTPALLIEYLLLKTPFMIGEFMPIMILIAASIYVTEISHHQELAAMRAAGLGIRKLLVPLFCVGLLAASFNFTINEWVTPITNQRLDIIEQVNVHNKTDSHQGTQWLKDGHRFYRLTPLPNNYFTMLTLETSDKGVWKKRMDASKAQYINGYWHLSDVYISEPDPKEGMQLRHQNSVHFASEVGPDTADPPSPNHMRFGELYRYTQNLERAGLNTGNYVLTLHRKLAAPLACMIMIILAVALSMNMGSRIAASSWGMVSAIVLGLLFYVFSNAGHLLAHGDHLPVAYAAWLPNLVFGGLAGFLLLHREGK